MYAKLTHMVKTQVYLREPELEALHELSERTGRSVADLVREAIRRTWLREESDGPIGIFSGEPRAASVDHDRIYDEP